VGKFPKIETIDITDPTCLLKDLPKPTQAELDEDERHWKARTNADQEAAADYDDEHDDNEGDECA